MCFCSSLTSLRGLFWIFCSTAHRSSFWCQDYLIFHGPWFPTLVSSLNSFFFQTSQIHFGGDGFSPVSSVWVSALSAGSILGQVGGCSHYFCGRLLPKLWDQGSGGTAGWEQLDRTTRIQTLCSSGRRSGFWVLFIVGYSARSGFTAGLLCLSLTHLLQCGVFLVHPMYRNHSASFWVFLEETLTFVAVDLVWPWEEVSSGSS